MSKLTAGILWSLCILLLCFGCANPSFTDNPKDPNVLDEDGDGYPKSEDCNDGDKEIYPGAPERLNCIDDNCDGRIDEGTIPDNEDKDHDGYCPSTGDIGDCEGNPKRHPGAPEDGGDGSGNPNGIDDNCNGLVDDGLADTDLDGDGFTMKDGDCNDRDPFINPGAIEVAGMPCHDDKDCPIGQCWDGFCRCTEDKECSSSSPCSMDTDCKFSGETCKNMKCTSSYLCLSAPTGMASPQLKVCRDNADNNCDGKIDEIPEPCDDLSKLKQNDPYDYAKAMEICDTAKDCSIESSDCPGNLRCLNGRCSRVLSASFTADADPRARAIATVFAQKGKITPRAGKSFAILSTGVADYDPALICPQEGTPFSNQHEDPDPAVTLKEAYDYIELSLEILVPTNAQSFEFDFQFFSTEYPEFINSDFNDTFWVNLTSKKFNGNISFDKNGKPIRIKNAFFDICDPYPQEPNTAKMCTEPSVLLSGTGYSKECRQGFSGDFSVANGGSTGWLHTTSPVTPGETIKLSFSIFDKGDNILDSTVLIDNFQWKLTPATNPMTDPD